MNTRTQKARQILDIEGNVSQFGTGKFKVKSMTDTKKSYIVKRTGHGMVCECPDHKETGSDCHHIKTALMFSCRNLGYKNESFKIINRAKLGLCKFCESGNIVKNGSRNNTQGKIPMFLCNSVYAY